MAPGPERPGRALTISRWYFSGNASKHRCVCGRGPITLISPLSTFRSCGSSLILVLRRNLPMGSTRGSSFSVTVPVPMLGLSLSMVANLSRSKVRPPRPTRGWRKNTSPSPVSRRMGTTTSQSGVSTMIAMSEKRTSKNRIMIVPNKKKNCPPDLGWPSSKAPESRRPRVSVLLLPMPRPRRTDNFLQLGYLRPPAQLVGRKCAACHQHRRIARPSLGDIVRHRRPYNPSGCLDDLQHRKSLPVAQVEGMKTLLAPHERQCGQMGASQIIDMNVIPDAGAVARGVVVAEHLQTLPVAGRGLEYVWDQMGFRVVRFSDPAANRGPGGVEVTQAHRRKIGSRARISQDLLDHQLAPAIRVHRNPRMRFLNEFRHGFAEDRRGRREHQLLDAVALHRLQQRDRAGHVIVVILQRLHDRFANQRLGAEMHHGIESALREKGIQCRAIANVGLEQLHPRQRL